jgi:hypothetical protein
VTKFDSKGTVVQQWGGLGSQFGELHSPESVRVVPGGFVVVDDVGNHQGHVFTTAGKPVERFAKGGSAAPAPR